jgi:hypothetical protein
LLKEFSGHQHFQTEQWYAELGQKKLEQAVPFLDLEET